MATSGEFMIRWKRTARNKWTYFPKVYTNFEEAYSYAILCNKPKYGQNAPYRMEVVALAPTVVWEGKDNEPTVQDTSVDGTVQSDG